MGDRLQVGLLRALLAFGRWLPLPVLHGLARLLAPVATLLAGRTRRIAERNLTLCFPDLAPAARTRLLRASLAETLKAVVELPRVWHPRPERALALVREVRGENLLGEALAGGRGLIVLTPHLGCWEICNPWLATRMPFSVLYRRPRMQALEPILLAARSSAGSGQVRAESGALRGLFRALSAGQGVGILPDQQPKQGEGVFAPFFGIPALTMVLPGRLAQRTGAPVLLVYGERLSYGRGYRIHVLPAPADLHEADPKRAASALNAAVEACVRKLPSQYQWGYKRFSLRPEGEHPAISYRL